MHKGGKGGQRRRNQLRLWKATNEELDGTHNKPLRDTFVNYYSPTEGGMTNVSTLTSMTASMLVLLCRLDSEPTMALAASLIRLWSGRSSGWKDWVQNQRAGKKWHIAKGEKLDTVTSIFCSSIEIRWMCLFLFLIPLLYLCIMYAGKWVASATRKDKDNIVNRGK